MHTAPPKAAPLSSEMQAKLIVDAIADGSARSRSDLARALGLAPSTVSLRVAELTDRGLIVEEGSGVSSGGRRPRILRLRDDNDFVMVADLGATHMRLGRVDLTGALLETAALPVLVADGPEKTLSLIADGLRAMANGPASAGGQIRGIGIALPGPVNIESGGVDQPSRMPGWQGFDVRSWLEAEFGVPAVVDNDANMMAIGEHYAQLGPQAHSITVKAGTAIGSGIIVSGTLHRGATAAAGDITHTRVPAAASEACSCGNIGCLETVASGAGLVRLMRAQGREVQTTAEVLALVRNGDPLATTMLRTAGTYLGEVLSSVVNFFNPDAVFITGSLASSETFIAAVRSRIYEGCHPLVTQRLRIESASTGIDAGLYGAGKLALDRVSLFAG